MDTTLPTADAAVVARLTSLLDQLSLEQKVQLLTGRDFWTTWPMPSIGLRAMLLSDGPSGVRGEVWDERDPSLSLPSATALASAWDTAMAWRYGAAAAAEARRKGVDVVLGPTINLHRSPLGGRHFEAFSEDPVLTAELATSYVEGVQENGVGATPKHYVGNDSETDRFTVDARIDERTLRELYLRAFETSVTQAHAWLVMSAYNSVNGVRATENDLLETPLNSEWGFDGVVVSDWTAVRSLAAARASQDLVMPGPEGAWSAALIEAVRSGEVDDAAIDRKVARLLHLAARVGALEGFEPAAAMGEVEDGVAFVREAAAAGTVLLRNTGELPWSAAALTSVAVIGHNASAARFQGGGSATVLPERVVSPLEGLREALPGVDVTYSLGAVVQEGVAAIPLEQLTDPTGEPGVQVRFLGASGQALETQHRRSTALVWLGGSAPIAATRVLELTTRWTPDVTGTALLGFAAVGTARIWCDGELLLERTVEAEGTDLGAALLAPPSTSAPLDVVAGRGVDLRIEYDLGERVGPMAHSLGFTFGTEPDRSDPEGLIAAAAAAAASADVALVVVGTNSAVESEGYDRTSLALPGRQDDLVRAVVAANPRTVVVVNAGAPVLLPWRDDVAALAVVYFGGQEIGHAVADVLLGAVEPGGRLPTTWPAAQEDVPVLSTTPTDGALVYAEGLHIGYRAWLVTLSPAGGEGAREPAYWFGHGLGYTDWSLGEPMAPATVAAGEVVEVSVPVTNTGSRRGKQVVQVYAERPGSAIERPVRWLVGFTAVVGDPGQSLTASVTVPSRLLAHWEVGVGWAHEPGEFTLRVGTSVTDLTGSVTLVLDAPGES